MSRDLTNLIRIAQRVASPHTVDLGPHTYYLSVNAFNAGMRFLGVMSTWRGNSPKTDVLGWLVREFGARMFSVYVYISTQNRSITSLNGSKFASLRVAKRAAENV